MELSRFQMVGRLGRSGAALCGLLSLLLLAGGAGAEDEAKIPDPVFLGQTATQWLDSLVKTAGSREWRQQEMATTAALKRLGDSAVPPLAQLMHHDDHLVKTYALRSLRKYGKAALPHFASIALMMQDDDYVVAKSAEQTVEQLLVEVDGAVAEAVKLLAHEDAAVRRSMAVELGRLSHRGRAALPALKALAETDADPLVRQEAERAIQFMGRNQ